MAARTVAGRGTFFDLIDDPWKHVGREADAARFVRDGLLVIENGIIVAFGPFAEVSPKYPSVPVTHLQNRIIVPGFIDGHIHFPQTSVLSSGCTRPCSSWQSHSGR